MARTFHLLSAAEQVRKAFSRHPQGSFYIPARFA